MSSSLVYNGLNMYDKHYPAFFIWIKGLEKRLESVLEVATVTGIFFIANEVEITC